MDNNIYLLIIYDAECIDQLVPVIKNAIDTSMRPIHFKIYVFSNGQYAYAEDFESVLPNITLCALPDAIYKAYMHVLPKKHRKPIVQIDDDAIANETNTLF